MKTTGTAISFVLSILVSLPAAADVLREAFLSPPDSARPWVLWYWMDGQIDRDGITKDLEAMARNGIGGVVLGDIAAHSLGKDAVRFLSPRWQDLFAHTLQEARRLGLVVSTCPSAGWCALGGPWIKPEDSMQVLVWSSARVSGPRRFAEKLPRPQIVEGYYRDVAVLAFPSPAEPLAAVEAIRITAANENPTRLVDGDPQTTVTLRGGTSDQCPVIELQFKEPVKIRGAVIEFTDPPRLKNMRFEAAGADGRFASAGSFAGKIHGTDGKVFRAAVDFRETTAEYLRIVLSEGPGGYAAEIAEIDIFGENLIPGWLAKSGADVTAAFTSSDGEIPRPGRAITDASRNIPLDSLVDLSGKMSAGGSLDWQVPEGDWTILRFGHTSRGARNRPAKEGEGLESDKFRSDVTRLHFDHYIGMMAQKHREYMGSTFVAMWQDSWETGCQNWSPVFVDEFKRRRGYDPIRYLPAMTGRAVGNGALSDRFLWDVRRTIADLSADNYLGTLAKLGQPYGIGLWFQPINRHFLDGLQAVGRATGAETNMHFRDRDKEKREYLRERFCASAAHGYGQIVVHSEAATAAPPSGAFVSTPASIRELVNANFCTGVNNHWMHVFLHQPWRRPEPGLSWGWGLQFQRNNTWFEKLDGWSSYVTRGQYLLRQGLPVVDIACFIGEAVPTTAGQAGIVRELNELPAGIDYDISNAEIILTRMSAKGGRVVLPDGMSYALLYLPEYVQTMRPAVLRKIRDLVLAGAVLVGNRPSSSPSLENYPACDREVKKLAEELWGRGRTDADTGRRVGSGMVYSAGSLDRALAARGVVEDFSVSSAQPDARIEYYHRRTADTDTYFVANRLPRAEEALCAFRVDGRSPELWQPDTGACEMVAVFRRQDGRTVVPLRFPPFGSMFVVFRNSPPEDSIVSVAKDGRVLMVAGGTQPAPGGCPAIFETVRSESDGSIVLRSTENGSFQLATASGKTETVVVASAEAPVTVAGPWDVRFASGRGAPQRATFDSLVPWNEHADPGIKYFSGTATYCNRVTLPASTIGGGKRLYLDLGEVREVAEVTVNGKSLGTLWKTPYRVDVTTAARAGDNALAIEVVNLWVNRMIGDERMYPDDVEWAPQTVAGWSGFGMRRLPAWFDAWNAGRGLRPTGRTAFSTTKFYSAKDPLVPSGLIGPVRIFIAAQVSK